MQKLEIRKVRVRAAVFDIQEKSLESLYGGNNESTSIELDSKELFMQFKHEAFHASILTLKFRWEKRTCIT